MMAIGPVTNIALAIRLDPEFIGRLSQLYVGAGHIYSKYYGLYYNICLGKKFQVTKTKN